MVETKTLGDYRLIRSLGRGSNAEVFLAQPLRSPQTRVVVKRIHRHVCEHPKFQQMFDAEVRSMANFSHPYVVGFLGASREDPEGPYLVLEYVPGQTLEQVLQRHRRLGVERVVRLMGKLCHALESAHRVGIIHRDLKPSNIMVMNVGAPDESIKVMDFGFAGFTARPHLQLAELTGRGPIFAVGTPGYVSPEMIRGDTVDGRSDLYSVGVMIYELLTGRLPFNDADEEKVLAAHVKQPPPAFHRIGCAFLSLAVENVVQQALAKFPNERQQSARELADALGKAVGEYDLWEKTAPPEGDRVTSTVVLQLTPPPQPSPELPHDRYRLTFSFEAMMPEKIAAAKIKGFVEDFNGEVLDSEPGRIYLRLGLTGYRRPDNKSALFSWIQTLRKPSIPRGHEPIEVELRLEKPDPSSSRLKVSVTLRPMPEYMPKDAELWNTRCDRLRTILRQYLGG